MSKGLQAYPKKERREIRRRNHMAYDLGHSKYRQRVKEGKRHLVDEDDYYNEYREAWEDYWNEDKDKA